MEGLSEEERKALRGSKFAPLPLPPPPSLSQARQAHPGGPLKTNKAAALAKFLERKLQEPSGLANINPDLLELAVKNAKDTVNTCGTSNSRRTLRHAPLDSFEDGLVDKNKPKKHKKKKKKNQTLKMVEDRKVVTVKKPKKKLKL